MAYSYIDGTRKQFAYYKSLGDRTFAQLSDEALFWQYNSDSNSIAIIVKHLWGNMLSRFTDFLTSDGEKEWRQREAEFDADIQTRTELLAKWEEGWQCVFKALDSVDDSMLDQLVYIRNMGHTIVEALNRQLAHYAYHIGQIVYLAKMSAGADWTSLTIPRGESASFNQKMFSREKRKGHFSEDYLGEEEKES